MSIPIASEEQMASDLGFPPREPDMGSPVVLTRDVLSKQPLAADRMLQWFEYEHLPPHLQLVSAPFCTLAHRVVRDLPANPERTVALRKLLEAKDCAVRALLYKDEASR